MFTKKIETQILFIHEFLTFIKAGVPLSESLDFLRKQTSLTRKMRKETERLYQDVMKGEALADSLRKRTSFFEEWQLGLIDAAEKSGTLQDGFIFIKSILETKKEHIKKMVWACLHPAFYTIIFIIFYPLRELIGVLLHRDNAYLVAYLRAEARLWIIIISIFFFFSFLPVIFQSKLIKRGIDGLVLLFPLFGKAVKDGFLHQFFYVFGSCYSSGCSVLQSWELASKMNNNQSIAKKMKKGEAVLRGNGDLDTAFFVTKIFPEKIINLIKVGIKSGTMKDQTERCRKIYYERYDMDVKKIEMIVPKLFYFIIVFLLLGIIFQIVNGYTCMVTNLIPLDQAL